MVIKVLDEVFIRLVDSMGTDASLVPSALVSSFPFPPPFPSSLPFLLSLLLPPPPSPFEMCSVKFHVKMPIFVARQWVRHRTAKINEYSGRYSEMPELFFNPTEFRVQSKTNKQGSKKETIKHEIQSYDKSFTEYRTLLNKGVAREMARITLPLATYTEWYWKNDLNNIFKFLKLRMDAHSQKEIRVYADAMATIIQSIYPVAYEAFVDYQLEAMSFSKQELILLSYMMNGKELSKEDYKILGKREQNEFKIKLKKINARIS